MKHQKCPPQDQAERRVYTLCSFDRGLIVPKVLLVDALTDEEAVACARDSDLCNLREVWDSRRLVAVIQPRNLAAGS